MTMQFVGSLGKENLQQSQNKQLSLSQVAEFLSFDKIRNCSIPLIIQPGPYRMNGSNSHGWDTISVVHRTSVPKKKKKKTVFHQVGTDWYWYFISLNRNVGLFQHFWKII